jgi:hypothetical protein
MKTVKILLITSLLFMGCKKQTNPPIPPTINCYCGNVELQYIKYAGPNGTPFEWNYISRNNCTNAGIRFATQTEYTDKEYCLTYQW